jgi:hypothetical protein
MILTIVMVLWRTSNHAFQHKRLGNDGPTLRPYIPLLTIVLVLRLQDLVQPLKLRSSAAQHFVNLETSPGHQPIADPLWIQTPYIDRYIDISLM